MGRNLVTSSTSWAQALGCRTHARPRTPASGHPQPQARAPQAPPRPAAEPTRPCPILGSLKTWLSIMSPRALAQRQQPEQQEEVQAVLQGSRRPRQLAQRPALTARPRAQARSAVCLEGGLTQGHPHTPETRAAG